jgi:ribose/xylose/arabinose/galactoside ABC-type transport system permease subunit
LKGFLRKNQSQFGLLAAIILLMVYFTFTAPHFFTSSNQIDILRQMSMIAMIAIGMTLIIITGEIDLSVGSLVAASSAIFGFLVIKQGVIIPVAALVAIVMGAAGGFSVAFLRNRYGIPSFITTLGLLSVWRGIAYMVTSGFPLSPYPSSFEFLGSGFISFLPVTVVIMIILYIVFYYVLAKTPFGRYVYATGSNIKAAQLSGVPVKRVKTIVFIVTGMISALVGIIISSRLMSSTPSIGTGWELDVIAAVIVGGTSLFGGRGTLIGTFLGAYFISVLGNGMVLLGVSPYSQLVTKGLIIVLAVFLNTVQTNGWKGKRIDEV